MNDIKTTYHYDGIDDRLTIKREQDVEGHLDAVKALKEKPKYVDGLGYFAGTIPAIVIEEYIKTVGITFADFMEDDKHINRILNDPDYKKFRVWEGRV